MRAYIIGEKYIIAGVIRGPEDMSLFLDGTELNVTYGGGGVEQPNFTSDPFKIATTYHAGYNIDYFHGKLDELRIWNIALTNETILANYNVEIDGDEEGLVGYWNFNAGEGTTLYDHSGNGNHGNINGATWLENIEGCTDSNATNYNEVANVDDGSCEFSDIIGTTGPAGGLIFYDKGYESDGWRYIAAAPDNWYNGTEPTTTWGCSGTTIDGADGYELGSGKQNTLDIVNGCSGETAASSSLDAVINGYDDWYLPSIDELFEMYTKLAQNGLGGFETHYYWSSTEYSSIGALFIEFGLPDLQYENIHDTNKQTWTEYFRPIRYFTDIIEGCTDPLAGNFLSDAEEDDGSCMGSPVSASDFTYAGELDGHYYYLSNYHDNITWEDAKSLAENNNGHLVTIQNDEENNFITELMYTNYEFNYIVGVWLGLTQNSNSSEPNGGWAWITGEPLSYTNWMGGEPNENISNEDYANLIWYWGPGDDSRKGLWNDVVNDGEGNT